MCTCKVCNLPTQLLIAEIVRLSKNLFQFSIKIYKQKLFYLIDILRIRGMKFIQGTPRDQTTLFPSTLDQIIAEDNPVRAIDTFVESLDLEQMGF